MRSKWCLALGSVVLASSIVLSAPPGGRGGGGRPGGGAGGRPIGGVPRPVARPGGNFGGRPGGVMPQPSVHPQPPVHPPAVMPQTSRPPITPSPGNRPPGIVPKNSNPPTAVRPQPNTPSGLSGGGRTTVPNHGGLAGRPHGTGGGPPLLTNPDPSRYGSTRPKPPGKTSGAKPPDAAAARAAAAANIAARVNNGVTPGALALYLYSQRNSRDRWWRPGFGYAGFGFGYPGFGYGPFGYPGFGYPGFGFYGFNPFLMIGFACGSGFGYGGPVGFGPGYGFGYSPVIPYAPVYQAPLAAPPAFGGVNPPLLPQGESVLPTPGPVPPAGSPAELDIDFAQRGQELFLEGKYAEAVRALRHAVLDDPNNGPLLALIGEALWADEKYNEAAGAIQQSLLATPEEDWTAVAGRAARLIPAESVRKLAKALGEKELSEMRFLAGYQSFGAGKYAEAAAHLDYLLKDAPNDKVAEKLRDQAAKLAEGK